MFLSKDELVELSGSQRPKVIAKWLDRNGFRFIVGIDGWPRVLKSTIETKLGGQVKSSEPKLRLA